VREISRLHTLSSRGGPTSGTTVRETFGERSDSSRIGDCLRAR
jgi:hypothetical protein